MVGCSIGRVWQDTTDKWYNGYIVNGVRFHTKAHERCLKTQNSGIVVTLKTRSYANFGKR